MPSTQESIRGVPLWDGVAFRGASRIEWSGDRIETVADDEPAHDDLCVIPGLIDTHVHLGAYSGTGHADWSSWPLITPWEEQVFHIAHNAQKAARREVHAHAPVGGHGAAQEVAVQHAHDDAHDQWREA